MDEKSLLNDIIPTAQKILDEYIKSNFSDEEFKQCKRIERGINIEVQNSNDSFLALFNHGEICEGEESSIIFNSTKIDEIKNKIKASEKDNKEIESKMKMKLILATIHEYVHALYEKKDFIDFHKVQAVEEGMADFIAQLAVTEYLKREKKIDGVSQKTIIEFREKGMNMVSKYSVEREIASNIIRAYNNNQKRENFIRRFLFGKALYEIKGYYMYNLYNLYIKDTNIQIPSELIDTIGEYSPLNPSIMSKIFPDLKVMD